MTLNQRYQWAYGTAVVLTTVAYAAWLAVQLSQRPAAQIEFTRALLITLLASFVIHTFARGSARGGVRKEDALTDDRDRAIAQRGDALTFYVFSGLAAIPLVLGLADVDPFWITNSLFFAFALAAIFGIVAKSVLYGHHLKEH